AQIPLLSGIPHYVPLFLMGLFALLIRYESRTRHLLIPAYCWSLLGCIALFITATLYSPAPLQGLELVAKLVIAVIFLIYIYNTPQSISAFTVPFFAASSLLLGLYAYNSYLIFDSPYLVNSLDLLTT